MAETSLVCLKYWKKAIVAGAQRVTRESGIKEFTDVAATNSVELWRSGSSDFDLSTSGKPQDIF